MVRTIDLLDADLSDSDKVLIRKLIQKELIEGEQGKLRHKQTYTVDEEQINLSHSIGKSGDHYSVYERGTQSLGRGHSGAVKPIYDIKLTQSSFIIHNAKQKVVKTQKAAPSLENEKIAAEKYYETDIHVSTRKTATGSVSYLILPRVSGVTLGDFFDSDDFKKFTYAERVALAKAIVDEVVKFYEKTGFFHNDLGMYNIMYNPETKAITLIDFGLASGQSNWENDFSRVFSKIQNLVHNAIEYMRGTETEHKNSFSLFKELQTRLGTLETIASLPEKARLAALIAKADLGFAPLSYAADQPESLREILTSYPKSARLAVVQAEDYDGKTALHYAVSYPESLKVIFSLLPKKGRLAAAQRKGFLGYTLLHHAGSNSESLKVILTLYPKQARLAAIQDKNDFGGTPLGASTNSPESLKAIISLLPEQDRLAAVQTRDKYGGTLMHKVAFRFEYHLEQLKVILELLPKQDLLAAVQEKNNLGKTPLDYAADDHKSLKAILSSLPEKDQFAAAQSEDEEGQLFLEKLVLNKDSSFCKAALSGVSAGDSLFVYYLALDAIKLFLQDSEQPSSGFFSQNEMINQAKVLRSNLNKCTNGAEVREAVTNFLSESQDSPTKSQIDLLGKLTESESITAEDYSEQLAALTQQWESKFGEPAISRVQSKK